MYELPDPEKLVIVSIVAPPHFTTKLLLPEAIQKLNVFVEPSIVASVWLSAEPEMV
jgi:hypothetical protein